MEAPGHEYIEKDIALFFKELLEINGKMGNFSAKNTLSRYYSDKKTDTINRAMYLGNWLTDNSQIFAPDTFFDLQYNLKEYIIALGTFAENNKVKFKEIVLKKIKSNKVGDAIFNENKILKSIDNTFKPIQSSISFLSKLQFQKPNKDSFRYDSRDEWWAFSESVLKCLGYKKFCLEDDDLMPFQVFSNIISSFIDQNNVDENDKSFFFKLNQYYPNDHLDRAFDKKYLETEKRKDLIERERRNCFDDEKKNTIYKYLHDYINILGSKLNYLSAYFITPVFLEDKVNEADFYINCARLGHTLHGVEDFFAHSNFLELTVSNLDRIREQTPNSNLYFTKDEFVAELSKKKYENDRYERSTYKPIRRKDESIELENLLSTGIFAERDTYTSLYHIIFGHLEKALDDVPVKLTETTLMDVIVYFMEYLQDYIARFNELDSNWQIATNNEKPFTVEIFKFILNRNSDPKKKIHNPNFYNKVDDQQIVYYVDLLNCTARIVNGLKLVTVPAEGMAIVILSFISIFCSIVFAPYYYSLLIKQILKDIPTTIIRTLIKDKLVDGLQNVAKNIEDQFLVLSNPMMYGTHSIMAKDESYRNENWNYSAKRMATFMDKYILLNMFLKPDKGSFCNFKVLLHQFLTHPFSEGVINTKEVAEQIKENGVSSTFCIIDAKTNTPIGIPLNNILMKGLHKRISTLTNANTYIDLFLEANPEINITDIKNKVTVKDIHKRSRILKHIILPFQDEAYYYYYENGKLITTKHKTMKPVVIYPQNPYKLWMIQFFSKEHYEKFFVSTSFLKELWGDIKEIFKKKGQKHAMDKVHLEQKFINFWNENGPALDFSNPTKIQYNEINTSFELEIKMKKEYETFIEEFIKIKY